MVARPESAAPTAVWRDDVATPVTAARLLNILCDPRDGFSRPEWLARHVGLSPDEKRVALCAWLRDLLTESHDGVPLGAVAPALDALQRLDPGAAAVFRRAFAAHGLLAS